MANALEVEHFVPATPDDRPVPLLLVHGICHGAWCWRETYAPFFAAHGYDVHALSLRGHAGSPGREALDSYGFDVYVADVLEVARSLLAPPVVVGHSMGGALVQLAVPEDPTAFSGAVLLASHVPGGLTVAESARLSVKLHRMAPLLRLLNGKRLTPAQANRLLFFDGRLSAAQAERAAALLQPESRRALNDVRRFNPPARPFPLPLLVLGSRRDSIFGAAAVRRTARHYGVEPIVLDAGCHDLMLDPTWEVSARVIADWLATLG